MGNAEDRDRSNAPPSGADLIAAERQRQVTDEGWTPEHDLSHRGNDLAWAAVCYAAPERVFTVTEYQRGPAFTEPWPGGWRRSEGDRIRQLVKAGALIAAEIDRLQRLEQDRV